MFRRSLLFCLLLIGCLVAPGCTRRVDVRPLPGEAELEPDRLIIFVHGYLRGAAPMWPLVDALTREGLPRAWVDSRDPESTIRFHGHLFDFYHYTRPGSDRNAPVEALVESLSQFYHSLPESCPICRRRANRPVEVTLVGHSFGGIVTREFLLREEEHTHLLEHDIPGGADRPSPWKISRVVTTGTPFFGSMRTRLSKGALSLFLNGLVRTLVLGFVKPEQGGVFGNVMDAQARALRVGSLYLWNAQLRWAALAERERKLEKTPVPWLVVAGIGYPAPELQGDNTTRFTSTNLEPVLPDYPYETLVVNLPHRELVRHPPEGRRAREGMQVNRAIARFVMAGTLRDDPAGAFGRFAIVPTDHGDVLVPDRMLLEPEKGRVESAGIATTDCEKPQRRRGKRDGGTGSGCQETAAGSSATGARPPLPPGGSTRVSQWIYMQVPPEGDAEGAEDLQMKMRRFERILASDTGDLWLRFYDGVPGRDDRGAPQVLALTTPLSLFQNGVEASRDWGDLVATEAINADGETIPIMHAMAPARSHLITVPDLTPTGPYRLSIRLARVGWVRPELVSVALEGSTPRGGTVNDITGVRVDVHPRQANLVHVYLDTRTIRREVPGLKRVEIREVVLIPERETSPPLGLPTGRNRRRAAP